ncbi:hypothetical protein Pint_27426 [Pistacia integerrima]|uniref:Uncharacterized protein n=1 Tax=Pistacia integerrima TaxID=434235 RepID=A0ACC0YMC9_9ROSI|nr:hypothetical protein Pint_27426 [Pistacia integerrima]
MVSTEFVTKILEMCPSLLLQVNAKTEEEEIDLESGLKPEWETLQMTNYENNTALHEAVRHKRFHVVKILTEKGDPDFHYSAHNLGETPLYLAAARGYKDDSMVIQILERCTSAAHEGPNGKTALHAAAIACSSSTVEKIIEKKKSLIKVTDQHGWTPLHYAAYYGNDVVELLLKGDRSTAYIGDKDRRMTPLHMAAGRGNLKAMKTIISNCPECYELEDNRGWNVLHFAMLGLDEEDLKHLLRESSLIRSLINKKDAKGNTPLHILAATHPNYYIDYSWGDMEAVNNQNVSVLDIIIYGYSELEKEIQELSKDVGKGNQYPKGVIRLRKGTKIEDRQKEYLSAEDEKETRASHLVVATLIATVTFAAAFTFPGGYNSEKGPNQGTAILYRNPAFQAFIITDTIAMTLSLSAVFIHLFLSTKKIQKSEDLSIQLLGIALIITMFSMGAMVIAFIAGTYAVLAPSLGLAITTCFIGFIFFLLVFCVLRLILKSE